MFSGIFRYNPVGLQGKSYEKAGKPDQQPEEMIGLDHFYFNCK
jgi:hypothetical protein